MTMIIAVIRVVAVAVIWILKALYKR